MRTEAQIDMEVVDKLYDIDRRLLSKPKELVCRDIIEKKFHDYVGTYELIKHNKMKRELQQ